MENLEMTEKTIPERVAVSERDIAVIQKESAENTLLLKMPGRIARRMQKRIVTIVEAHATQCAGTKSKSGIGPIEPFPWPWWQKFIAVCAGIGVMIGSAYGTVTAMDKDKPAAITAQAGGNK